MEKVSFEILKKDICFKLVYPDDILATIKDALEILEISDYFFKKLRKKEILTEFPIKGNIFFYKDELFEVGRENGMINKEIPIFSKNVRYDNLERRVYIKLIYPEDVLLSRKTGPSFIKVHPMIFEDLRKMGKLKDFEYDFKGVKFFYKGDLANWAAKNEKLLNKMRGF
jgi:hypothetical protein